MPSMLDCALLSAAWLHVCGKLREMNANQLFSPVIERRRYALLAADICISSCTAGMMQGPFFSLQKAAVAWCTGRKGNVPKPWAIWRGPWQGQCHSTLTIFLMAVNVLIVVRWWLSPCPQCNSVLQVLINDAGPARLSGKPHWFNPNINSHQPADSHRCRKFIINIWMLHIAYTEWECLCVCMMMDNWSAAGGCHMVWCDLCKGLVYQGWIEI